MLEALKEGACKGNKGLVKHGLALFTFGNQIRAIPVFFVAIIASGNVRASARPTAPSFLKLKRN